MSRFPKCNAFMDDLKRAFGDDQVQPVWAEEGGNRAGRRDDSLVAVRPALPVRAEDLPPVVEQPRTKYKT